MKSINLLSTAALLSGLPANAEELRYWAQPTDGDWNVESRWSPSDIPDSPSEVAMIAALGQYTVRLDRSTLLGALYMSNPGATLEIPAGNSLYVATASASVLTIEGLLSVNPTGENRITEIGICEDTYQYYDGNFGGGGVTRLNAHPQNLDSARIVGLCSPYYISTRIGHNHTIAGSGRIRISTLNEGDIVADTPNAVLEVARGVGNGGTLRATGGGILQLSAAIDQNNESPGMISCDDAASELRIAGAFLGGGLLTNLSGGRSRFVNYDSTLRSITLEGVHEIEEGVTVRLQSAVWNNGTLIVGRSEGTAAQLTDYFGWGTALFGVGTVRLNASPADSGLAQLGTENLSEITLGLGQTLSGNGRVSGIVENYGRISPGAVDRAVGVIELRNCEWIQNAASQFVVDLAGTAPELHDRLIGDGTISWDGALVVAFAPGYMPAMGDDFVLATHAASNGAFARIEVPPASRGIWRVRYDANATVLAVTCSTDLDGDHQTGLTDLAVLLAHFGETADESALADLDHDGVVMLQDLAILLSRFGMVCR